MKKNVFNNVVVYDSLRRSSRRAKEGVSKFHSVGEKVLMKFQKYLSTFDFFDCEDTSAIIQNENYILEKLVYKECPQQENLQDCSLFGLITLIHLANNIEVTYETFNHHISGSSINNFQFKVGVGSENRITEATNHLLGLMYVHHIRTVISWQGLEVEGATMRLF